jgi:drug/metabolite transporter (DMT)-like permease
MKPRKDYIVLHVLVLLNSLVPSVAIYIQLHPIGIILQRTLMASLMLAVALLVLKKDFWLGFKHTAFIMFTGMLTAAFMILFFLTAKKANASVALITLATSSLWIGFLNPLFTQTSIKFNQIVLGINALFGMYIIFSDEFVYGVGFIMGILAAMLGGIVTIFTSQFSQKFDNKTITFYQMVGAMFGTCIYIPVVQYIMPETEISLIPQRAVDWFAIAALAFIFSVVAYSALIWVLKTIPPFVVSLTTNLSPVYGTIIGLLLDPSRELMSVYFYAGSIIILASIVVVPIAQYYFSENIPVRDPQTFR